MKKYWKTLVISLVIVMTISSYYIQLVMASNTDVTFKIETTSGNKEEIENLVLQGTFESDGIHHWLYITNDGSTNRLSQSFFRNRIAYYEPFMFQKYIQEHRNFMRGKEFDPSKYFEDEARLIYTTFLDNGQVVQGNLLTLQIDLLDKNTNDSSSFKIKTPVQASYNWMNVNNVYVENGEIKILATGYLNNGEEELRTYTVDENKKELVDDSIIAKSVPGMSSIRIFNDLSKIQNETYYLFKEGDYDHQMENADSEIIHSQMYIYNNSTSEVEELDIPSDLKPFMNSIVIQGVDIFIPVQSASRIQVNRYNIEKKIWEEPLYFNYPSTANDEEEPFKQFIDGKLFLVNRVSDGYSLFIGDLRTGESLYEGKIIGGNRENLDTDYSLDIEQLFSIN